MKALIDWLMKIEQLAANLYSEAASYFTEPSFIQFLQHSAEDERIHHQMMINAHKSIDRFPDLHAAYSIDENIKATIEGSFQKTGDRLHLKSLSKEMMIDCIVATEYSEWNDIFLYVVNTLKSIDPKFKPAAASLQHHLRHIEHYLNSDSHGRRKIRDIQALKSVWKEKILIVEDDPTIASLLKAVLEKEGTIDTAENGKSGLAKIRKNYYRMIISDVDMPLMDGIAFFNKAHAKYPNMKNRFLFVTGNPNEEALSFFKSNDLKFLLKPTGIDELRNQVMVTMHDIRKDTA